MNTRRILVILIVLLLIAALGLGVWNLFLKTPDTSDGDSGGNGEFPESGTTTREPARVTSTKATETESILPEPKKGDDSEERTSGVHPKEEKSGEEQKLKQLTEEEILGPTITKDGDFVKYYRKKDGRVFKVSFNGQSREKISDTKVPNLEDVNWSPGGGQVITTWVNENHRRRKTHYSYKTNEATHMDTRTKKINWAPNGEQIFYHFIDKTGKSNLAIAEPDNSNWQIIEPLATEATKLYYPTSNFVSILTPGSSFFPPAVHKLPLAKNQDEKKIKEGVKLDQGLLWSPEGSMFIYKEQNDDKLALFNLQDYSRESLKITSEISKCRWSKDGESIYCAMSIKEINEQGILPASYSKEFLPQSDSFWQIDLEEKKIRELYIPKSNQNVINVKKETLRVSPRENYLFWVDGGTNQLYRLKL